MRADCNLHRYLDSSYENFRVDVVAAIEMFGSQRGQHRAHSTGGSGGGGGGRRRRRRGADCPRADRSESGQRRRIRDGLHAFERREGGVIVPRRRSLGARGQRTSRVRLQGGESAGGVSRFVVRIRVSCRRNTYRI